MTDAFTARKQALENQFFRTVDQALVEIMREELNADETRQSLQSATGIRNKELLDALILAGVEPATLVAFFLLPLAQVAWADGKVDAEERGLVLNTAVAMGCLAESPSWSLLNEWLAIEPDDDLFTIWCNFASDIADHLSESNREVLTETVVERAEAVAHATGGVMGIGRVSATERRVIDRIRDAVRSQRKE